MKLYEITSSINELLMLSDDGELSPGTEEQLDALQMAFESKIEGCCCAVRNLEAESKALREEAERFAKRAQAAEASAKRLKTYVKSHLDALGIAKMDAGLFRVRTQLNGVPTTTYTGAVAALPEAFKRIKVELDVSAVVAAWRDGLPLPDGVACVRGSHLRIG